MELGGARRGGRPVTETEDLEEAMTVALAAPTRILARRPCDSYSSFALEELDVDALGDSLAVLWKDVGPAGLSDDGRLVKPDFILDPRREIQVYEHILADHVPDAPELYGVVIEPSRGRYWLFIERIDGLRMRFFDDPDVLHRAARWLARMHLDCASVTGDRLLVIDEAYLVRWLDRAEQFNPPEDVGWLRAVYPQVVERIAAMPQTFLHGEFYGSNVIVEESGRLRPVDWEMAARGPGLFDLASLTFASWSPELRDDLAATYHEELTGGARPEQRFLEELECCRLAIAVQWLGWWAGAQAPEEESHEWLEEARRAAERLGL